MARRKTKRSRCKECRKRYGRRTSTPYGYCSTDCKAARRVRCALSRDPNALTHDLNTLTERVVQPIIDAAAGRPYSRELHRAAVEYLKRFL